MKNKLYCRIGHWGLSFMGLIHIFPVNIGCKHKQVKLSLQRPAARYDGIGKIGGGYGSLVSMVT